MDERIHLNKYTNEEGSVRETSGEIQIQREGKGYRDLCFTDGSGSSS
jgi:hypothetical protein